MDYRPPVPKPKEIVISTGIGVPGSIRCKDYPVWENYTKSIEENVKKTLDLFGFPKGTKLFVINNFPILFKDVALANGNIYEIN